MTRMQKLLVGASAAVSLTSAGTAYAATVTVGESYTITESGFTGNKPGITDDLSGNLQLTKNTWSTPTNFFTASPAGSSGLSGQNPTVTGTITVTLTFTEAGGVTGSLTETGIFEAKYGGSPLSGCTNSPSGDTDCIVWTGASNTPTGSVMLSTPLSGPGGQVMDVTFYNAQDWNITPQISFDLDPTPAPLPAALPLFAGGLGVLGLITHRRKRKAAAVAG